MRLRLPLWPPLFISVLSVLLSVGGCTAVLDEGDPDSIDGKADGATAALEGTRAGYGVLRLLNDGEGTDFLFLDVDVALDRRAAGNLIAHRDGPDAVHGTRDDDLFDSIEEVDGVRWVGPAALEALAEFAYYNDYLPADDDVLGTFEGIELTYADADRVLAFANTATEEELRDASVPSRSTTSILAARPVVTMAHLVDLYWVGPRTLQYLLDAVALPVGGEVCETTDDCPGTLRCTGRPGGMGYGKCRDTTSYPGTQDDCDVDTDCHSMNICIAETVYGQGYCASGWMRESFTVGGIASIPSIAMSQPTASRVTVFGQATVPEDIIVDIDIEHTDPSSLWIGLDPPTGQDPVVLWDGATMTGPLPQRYIDRAIYRDDAVNGVYRLLIQNVGGRGTGVVREWTLTVTSRWD